jgi:hypothetical protein
VPPPRRCTGAHKLRSGAFPVPVPLGALERVPVGPCRCRAYQAPVHCPRTPPALRRLFRELSSAARWPELPAVRRRSVRREETQPYRRQNGTVCAHLARTGADRSSGGQPRRSLPIGGVQRLATCPKRDTVAPPQRRPTIPAFCPMQAWRAEPPMGGAHVRGASCGARDIPRRLLRIAWVAWPAPSA